MYDKSDDDFILFFKMFPKQYGSVAAVFAFIGGDERVIIALAHTVRDIADKDKCCLFGELAEFVGGRGVIHRDCHDSVNTLHPQALQLNCL